MPRQFFLDLAAQRHRTIIGADLLLHETADPESTRRAPAALGRLIEQSALRWRTPLAIPLMDLRLEKADLLAPYGFDEDAADRFHFDTLPTAELYPTGPFPERQRAQIGAISWIASNTNLLPCGMVIGPFSLTTKLLADPITPIALSLSGVDESEDPSVAALHLCRRLAEAAVARSVSAQLAAGARAIIVCEPAANVVFLSPRQLRSRPDAFDDFVLQPNLRIRSLMDSAGASLIFHDCGELTSAFVRDFAHTLRPAVLSLGAFRRLWEDAALLPPDVVLFGNLPTKTFYSDDAMPRDEVRRLTIDLATRMAATAHPFILASECDVLHVPEAAEAIIGKCEILLSAGIE